tara:strand:- start:203 stop:553 length:351 start_codon:yes stop_codon:yes gene_type:complete
MIDTDKYEGHTPVRKKWPRWCEDWLFSLYSGKTEDGSHTPTWNQDNALACDAPLLLEEVKRLRERLMLAESALGEVRACHEDGQGNLGEILEHYRDKEGVEMPNAFDEVMPNGDAP